MKVKTGAVMKLKRAPNLEARISSFSGSQALWDTFVNLGTGPRLMEYTLDMRSPNHTGKLFDDFSLSNFGYGGEPNLCKPVAFFKGSAYTFNGSFRRDQNIFDYDLFANPLNPATSTPNIPVLDSPHEFLLIRRMSDINLGIFPVGQVRFQLGWSRVVNEGTTFSTVHLGTESQLYQPTLNTTDNFKFGVLSVLFPAQPSITTSSLHTLKVTPARIWLAHALLWLAVSLLIWDCPSILSHRSLAHLLCLPPDWPTLPATPRSVIRRWANCAITIPPSS